jgi:two-component system, cell cycle response regulator DivK
MARILIIEDDAFNLEIAQYLLEHSGHRVSVATDGRSGLIAARRERPHLIICDLHLPALQGFGMLEQLKLDAACAHTPIVAVMAAAVCQAERAGDMAGFDGYLSMPIAPEAFVAQIETFLPSPLAHE